MISLYRCICFSVLVCTVISCGGGEGNDNQSSSEADKFSVDAYLSAGSEFHSSIVGTWMYLEESDARYQYSHYDPDEYHDVSRFMSKTGVRSEFKHEKPGSD